MGLLGGSGQLQPSYVAYGGYKRALWGLGAQNGYNWARSTAISYSWVITIIRTLNLSVEKLRTDKMEPKTTGLTAAKGLKIV